MKSYLIATLMLGHAATHALAGDPAWIIGTSGSAEIPAGAVWAGSEMGTANYVCRASYMGGIHPGKLLAGHCNIEFAGQELVRDDFEILTADEAAVNWVNDSMGYTSNYAFRAGEENGMSLYACRAQVALDETDRGMHAGKLIGENCNIPYGGGAYLSKYYSVLEIKVEEPPVAARKPVWKAVRAAGRDAAQGWSADGRALPTRSGAVLKAR